MIQQLRRVVFLAIILLSFSTAFSQSLVCRKPGIAGRDESAERAHRFLPPDTSDVSKAVIYVERTPKGIYFHSNYVTPGFDNPTKILTNETSDFHRVFVNLIFSGKSDPLEQDEALETYRKNVHIFLDQSMFTQGGYPTVDVGDATNVAVVDGRTGKLFAGDSVERLERTSPPPILLSKVLGCCMYGIPPHLAEQYRQALVQRPFDKRNVRFLSLVRDSGTESAIKQSANLRTARLGEIGTPMVTLPQIESAFQSANGSTVILVSHVEGKNFVVRDSAQNITSSIPVDSVRALASKYNIELVDLGCETAQHLRSETLGVGVTTKFNTVDAVQSLERALSQSQNYADFFQALTSENLKIVVDHGFMRGWPLCADVYAKETGTSVWVKLARIFVSFRQDQQKAIGISTQ